MLHGEIGWEMVTASTLMSLDSMSNEPLKIMISSPGGSLDAAFLLYDLFKMCKSPIYTVGSYCASAAALLMAAGTKRFLLPHAKVMLHLPRGGMFGDTREWEIQQKEMESYKNKLLDILVDNGAKKSREDICKDIDREYWMGPEETIAYGLADEILKPEVLREWLCVKM